MYSKYYYTCVKGGGKNLGGKSLVSAKNSFKTILIGLLISLLAMQCSKSGTTDPVVTPTPKTQSCASGQTMQADGTCKAPDGTITCPVGQNKNASGLCVAITCPIIETLNPSGQCVAKTCLSGQSLNASNGQCETITCPSGQVLNIKGVCEDICPTGQLRNAAGTCADISTFKTTCDGRDGLKGPSVMMFKYLDKTNPNPSRVITANADMAFIVVKGCEENNPTWLSSQSIFSALAYFEIKDNFYGVILSSLSFASNPWDSKIFSIGSDGSTLVTKILSFTPKNISNNQKGTGIILNYYLGVAIAGNCINSDCFARINNSIVTLPTDPGANAGFASYFIGGIERGDAITGTDLRDPTKYNPLVKNAINEMYTSYSMRVGVTWTSAQLESVLIK